MAFLKRFRPAVLALPALLAVLLTATAPAFARQTPAADEVKAAFICNFADFVEWPPAEGDAQGAPVIIGILGEDPFGRLLDEAADARSVETRKLEVRRFESLEQAAGARILYIGSSEEENLPRLLEPLAAQHVLTVSDLPDFAARGGIIGLLVEDKRVRLEINVAAAERAGLRISSRLLNLARLVDDPPRGGE